MSTRGIGGHQSAAARSETWLTPPAIIRALGPFDLDPCAAPEPRAFPTAARNIQPPDNGLVAKWDGLVWLNPPYGAAVGRWLGRLAEHGNGIALTFARTETDWFVSHVWNRATAILFLDGRIRFLDRHGRPAASTAGGPSVLIGYGSAARARLDRAPFKGSLVTFWRTAGETPPA